MKSFKHYRQHDIMDCGPTCLNMIVKFYGKNYDIEFLRKICQINKAGVSLLGLSEASEKIGFRSLGARVNLEKLKNAELPCILHWRQNHFVVLYKIEREIYHIADPAKDLIKYTEKEFISNWLENKEIEDGIVLFLSPTPDFFEQVDHHKTKVHWGYLFQYLKIHRRLINQLFAGLLIGSLLQLIGPFLTQAVVDVGVNTSNLQFVNIILIAQTVLFLGSAGTDLIRSWILLHVSTRVNISILTDFLSKLMRLPMSYFDTKLTGDIMQRMADQQRIEHFLTESTLSTLFSIVNLIIFTCILAMYDLRVFSVFIGASIIYTVWILFFMKKRRNLDYKRFDISSKNQSNIIQLIDGMHEIKLNNCEKQKRWQWEHLQAKLFSYNIDSLTLEQYQKSGALVINQGKNILISYLSAKAVITGDLTLGAMMAIQFIVGQLNSPIEQFIDFLQGYQDATMSMERLNEIHTMDDEESLDKELIYDMPESKEIALENLDFAYPGAGNELVLKSVNLRIPQGKTTAIVGMSGSGKTTILKLLLRFYLPQKGQISVGNIKLNHLSQQLWRSQCGIVMQDGYVFSDSISKNIAVAETHPNEVKLKKAIEIANLQDFIDTLPLGLNTKIGAEGNGISQGQKQRLLIARAIYKEPEYLLFDEATNALDAHNESVIMSNLAGFFKGRTVVVVAHRLSTVKNADNIIVLSKGEIIEQGTHSELIQLKGRYYQLVKNQLELGE